MSGLIETLVDWFNPMTLTEYSQEHDLSDEPAATAEEEYEHILSAPSRRPHKSRCLVLLVSRTPPCIIKSSHPLLAEDSQEILSWLRSTQPVEIHPNLYRVDLMSRIYIFRCRNYRNNAVLYGIVAPRTPETRMELLDVQSKYLLEV